MCTFPDERIHFIQISIQLPMLSLLECENNRGGGDGISKLLFPSYFEHFKKDRVLVQTSNKGNNYNPTQHR